MLKVLGYGYLLLIAVIILYANMGWDLFLFDWVKYVPYKDKLSHFILLGVLTFFVNVLLNFKQIKIRNRDFLLGSIFVFSFFTLEEASQAFIANRNCELLDFLCNTAGILVFEKIALKLRQHKLIPQKL